MEDNETLQLQAHFKFLKLETFMESLLQLEPIKQKTLTQQLLQFTEVEVIKRNERLEQSMVKVAGFPKLTTIDLFDFDFQPTLSKTKIDCLFTFDFIEKAENILFTGTPGVGKTHLSTAIGIAAARSRHSTYFIKAQRLITNLKLAYEENRIDARLKHYSKYKLLIIDELGYLPLDELEAKLLFQLIDKRYERKSTIITSNIPLDKWNTLINDVVLAQAIVDRLVHHAHLFHINGRSYRMKELLESKTDQS